MESETCVVFEDFAQWHTGRPGCLKAEGVNEGANG